MTDSPLAVFLSYASQDAPAALTICTALRAAGIDVWFDQSELRGGDAWDAAIRRQIKACALFMPVISTTSQSRAEGYFRLEWKLAVDRSHLMAAEKPFLVPVVVDDTPEADALVPDKFREVQWTRLPGGETPTSFVNHVQCLLSGEALTRPERPASGATVARRVAAGERQPAVAAAPRAAWQRPALGVLVVVMVAAGLYVALHRTRASKDSAVTDVPADVVARTAATLPAVSIPERSIAVLPFADMSENKDQEYFSDGLSEELIDLLAKVPDLRVPARTSSFYFKGQHATIAEIAKALGVTHVLEGSVRKAGTTIRVSTQLIRADTGYHEWSQTYDRDLKDVFKVQDEIAARVVGELQMKLPVALTVGRRTENTEAYNQFLLGRKLSDDATLESYQAAVVAFSRAVALDPNYAAAYALLGQAQAGVADNSNDKSGFALAVKSVDKAIALAPDAADGYFMRAFIASSYVWDWDVAAANFRKALSLEPQRSEFLLGYAGLLETQGNLAAALAAIDQSIVLDPLRARSYGFRGRVLTDMGDWSAARDSFRRSLELNPDMPHANPDLAILEVLAGRPAQAVEYTKRSAYRGWRNFEIAIVEYALGHREASQQALDSMIKSDGEFAAYQIASICAWLGKKDEAFAWLERAFAQADGGLTEVKVDPLLASLRSDPRYAALVRKMKLDP